MHILDMVIERYDYQYPLEMKKCLISMEIVLKCAK